MADCIALRILKVHIKSVGLEYTFKHLKIALLYPYNPRCVPVVILNIGISPLGKQQLTHVDEVIASSVM